MAELPFVSTTVTETYCGGCEFSHRMDGGDVESGDELHKDQRRLQELLRGAAGGPVADDGKYALHNGFRVTLHEDVIDLPRTWKRPRRIFLNSMSDLFHPRVPLWFIRRAFQTMENCPQHTFQMLTKRSDGVRKLIANPPRAKKVRATRQAGEPRTASLSAAHSYDQAMLSLVVFILTAN